MWFSMKEIKEKLPILILIILVFILYINNMPVDFNFNFFGFIEYLINNPDYGQYSNLKIFTISNIVLLGIFMYIYKISTSRKLPQEELINKIEKMSLFIVCFYLVLWGIMWWWNKYSTTKWLIKEKVINNVIVYDLENTLSYSITATGFLILFFMAFRQLMDKNIEIGTESYIYFVVIVLGIILLYLRWDGSWGLIKDLTEEPWLKLRKELLDGDEKGRHWALLIICICISILLVNPGGWFHKLWKNINTASGFGYFMHNENQKNPYLMTTLMFIVHWLIIFYNKKFYLGISILYIIYEIYDYRKNYGYYKDLEPKKDEVRNKKKAEAKASSSKRRTAARKRMNPNATKRRADARAKRNKSPEAARRLSPEKAKAKRLPVSKAHTIQ
jgi:hypothetical protein